MLERKTALKVYQEQEERMRSSISKNGKKVLLLLMPFGYPNLPGLSVALLRSILKENDIACDLIYGNLVFSKVVEGDPFFETQISKGPVAEMSFAPYYFETSKDHAAGVIHRYYGDLVQSVEKKGIAPYRKLVNLAGRFLDHFFDSISWDDYDIVGFSLMFQQTVASLALAKKIKAKHPHIKILFGGASCADPMGERIMRSFAEPDYVVMGEADAIIGPLVAHIRTGAREPLNLPGIVYREESGDVKNTGTPVAYDNLDALPIPDYQPYFEQLSQLELDHFHPYLMLETSRGCWWGQKRKCLFCALDPLTINFRSKSPKRVIDEIKQLSLRHNLTSFGIIDNIMNHEFYSTLLPEIKRLREEEEYDFGFFVEIKSNIRREHARILYDAGVVEAQPGIESFSDNLLKTMKKGVTGIRQIQALKFLEEFDIRSLWNVIYRLPNETPEDYERMTEMIPYLRHLQPPGENNVPQMLLMRYSAYFDQPEDFGITGIRPQSYYDDIFPGVAGVEELAYFFDYDHPDHEDERLLNAHQQFLGAVTHWRETYRKDSLVQTRGPGFVQISDKRDAINAEQEAIVTLAGVQADIFVFCDSVQTEQAILDRFEGVAPAKSITAFLDVLVGRRLIYRSPKKQYINLPLLKTLSYRQMEPAGV